MAEVTQDKVVKLLKQDDELTQGKVAQKLGVAPSEVGMAMFCRAQVEAGIYGKAPATAASVKKLRAEGNRWELIMARTGLSKAKVIELFGGEDAAKASYTGRGRDWTGNGSSGTTARTGRGAKTKTKTASKSKSKTAGKSKSKATAKKASAIQRNRTGRRSRVGNPS